MGRGKHGPKKDKPGSHQGGKKKPGKRPPSSIGLPLMMVPPRVAKTERKKEAVVAVEVVPEVRKAATVKAKAPGGSFFLSGALKKAAKAPRKGKGSVLSSDVIEEVVGLSEKFVLNGLADENEEAVLDIRKIVEVHTSDVEKIAEIDEELQGAIDRIEGLYYEGEVSVEEAETAIEECRVVQERIEGIISKTDFEKTFGAVIDKRLKVVQEIIDRIEDDFFSFSKLKLKNLPPEVAEEIQGFKSFLGSKIRELRGGGMCKTDEDFNKALREDEDVQEKFAKLKMDVGKRLEQIGLEQRKFLLGNSRKSLSNLMEKNRQLLSSIDQLEQGVSKGKLENLWKCLQESKKSLSLYIKEWSWVIVRASVILGIGALVGAALVGAMPALIAASPAFVGTAAAGIGTYATAAKAYALSFALIGTIASSSAVTAAMPAMGGAATVASGYIASALAFLSATGVSAGLSAGTSAIVANAIGVVSSSLCYGLITKLTIGFSHTFKWKSEKLKEVIQEVDDGMERIAGKMGVGREYVQERQRLTEELLRKGTELGVEISSDEDRISLVKE